MVQPVLRRGALGAALWVAVVGALAAPVAAQSSSEIEALKQQAHQAAAHDEGERHA